MLKSILSNSGFVKVSDWNLDEGEKALFEDDPIEEKITLIEIKNGAIETYGLSYLVPTFENFAWTLTKEDFESLLKLFGCSGAWCCEDDGTYKKYHYEIDPSYMKYFNSCFDPDIMIAARVAYELTKKEKSFDRNHYFA